MRSMKRVQRTVLFLIFTALFAASTALAGRGANVKLTPTGIEPDASGQAKLTNLKLLYFSTLGDVYSGTLSITCSGLAPNADYSTTLGIVRTSANGTLNANGRIRVARGWPIGVVVYNVAGNLVLSGTLVFK